MHPPAYLIVLKNSEKYSHESNAIAASHIHDVTGEPSEKLKRGINFTDDTDFIYYDGLEDGYIAKSDIETILDVKELIGEDVDSLDERFKIAPEDVPTHHDVQD